MMADKQMREFSVCRPPEYHQLHDNLNAMATESRGPPLVRSHGGPHSKLIASHHTQTHSSMNIHTHASTAGILWIDTAGGDAQKHTITDRCCRGQILMQDGFYVRREMH